MEHTHGLVVRDSELGVTVRRHAATLDILLEDVEGPFQRGGINQHGMVEGL